MFYEKQINKQTHNTWVTIIILRSVFLFDFEDKNGSSFWTNNEKAGNYMITRLLNV